MATQKRAEEIRGFFGVGIQKLEVLKFQYVGQTKEGLAFQEQGSPHDVVIVKAIVKKEDFDLEDALNEFQESVAKKLEKEKKHAEKVAKAEAKKKETK